MRKLLSRICLLGLLILGIPSLSSADEALDAARREYAVHLFDVNAHVQLAKQLHGHGQRLMAFFVLETAAELFDEAEFKRAFRSVFLNDNFDNSPEAEAELRARLGDSPNDFETLTKLADIYISRDDWGKAVPLLQQASKLQPEDFAPVAALANVYERQNEQGKAQALASAWAKEHPFSLSAYQTKIYARLSAKETAAPRPLVEEALKRYPNDGALHFDLAVVLERTNDIVGAQREFERAAKLGAESAQIQGWVARFFWKRKQDPRRALEFYLNAYFLDPDFYETEYVKSRIPRVAREAADLLTAESRKNSSKGADGSADLTSLSPLLEETRLGVEKAHWSAHSLDKVLEIMGSDDTGNRWNAMQLAAGHLNEISDDRLTRLLEEPDLRKRGMAGYLAVQRWHEKAFPVMKTWLQDSAELVRYDAISALGMYGDDAGRKLVEEYLASGKEPNARMREYVEQALAKTGDRKQK